MGGGGNEKWKNWEAKRVGSGKKLEVQKVGGEESGKWRKWEGNIEHNGRWREWEMNRVGSEKNERWREWFDIEYCINYSLLD